MMIRLYIIVHHIPYLAQTDVSVTRGSREGRLKV